MDDIARIREEIKTLIDRLSKEYLHMKQRERAGKKAKRLAIENLKTSDEDNNPEGENRDAVKAALKEKGNITQETRSDLHVSGKCEQELVAHL